MNNTPSPQPEKVSDPLIRVKCGCPTENILYRGIEIHIHADNGEPISAFFIECDIARDLKAKTMDEAIREACAFVDGLLAAAPPFFGFDSETVEHSICMWLFERECPEDDPHQLVWTGGPIPEPYGDKYLAMFEKDAASLIARLKADAKAFDDECAKHAPQRDREADRARYTDPNFNRWLDEPISDSGCTAWDAVPDVDCAWAGWEAHQYYAPPPAAEAQGWREDAEKYRALNTPEIHDFLTAVEREALHQRDRWGSDHDAGKTEADWFWLIGYLAGKAINKPEKSLHHIITTAAACLNWHAAKIGAHTAMRPGIEPPSAGGEGEGR